MLFVVKQQIEVNIRTYQSELPVPVIDLYVLACLILPLN